VLLGLSMDNELARECGIRSGWYVWIESREVSRKVVVPSAIHAKSQVTREADEKDSVGVSHPPLSTPKFDNSFIQVIKFYIREKKWGGWTDFRSYIVEVEECSCIINEGLNF